MTDTHHASRITHHEKKRILIVNVNWLGDVLFTTPFIRSVRAFFPDDFIAVLLHPRCLEMLRHNPRIDEIILYDEEGIHRSIFGKYRLIAELREKRFDLAFILHRSCTKALITLLAGVKERVGYATKHRGWLLTKVADEPIELAHKVEYFLSILDAAGIPKGGLDAEFYPGPEDETRVRALLASKGIGRNERFIVINPGGNWDPKRWPKERFAKAADLLAEAHSARIVITGAAKDRTLAEAIGKLMKHPPVLTCGETTLGELGALCGMAALVVTNDSGPMHIAVAMKAKVIALFGPTDPRITGPFGSGSYTVLFKNETCPVPCYDVTCTDNRCMRAVTVEDVIAAARELLR